MTIIDSTSSHDDDEPSPIIITPLKNECNGQLILFVNIPIWLVLVKNQSYSYLMAIIVQQVHQYMISSLQMKHHEYYPKLSEKVIKERISLITSDNETVCFPVPIILF